MYIKRVKLWLLDNVCIVCYSFELISFKIHIQITKWVRTVMCQCGQTCRSTKEMTDLHQVSRGGLVHGIRVMKKTLKSMRIQKQI